MEHNQILLNHISSLVESQVTNGHYPYWKLSTKHFNRNELSDITLTHIAKNIRNGFKEGEIVEERENQKTDTGWWTLFIED